MEAPTHLTLISTRESGTEQRRRRAKRRIFGPLLIVPSVRVKAPPVVPDWSTGQRLSSALRAEILAHDIAEIEKIRDQIEKGNVISRLGAAARLERRRYRITGRITPAAQLALLSFPPPLWPQPPCWP